MQELEKILEEIKKKKDRCLEILKIEINVRELDEARGKYKGLSEAENIIKKNMDDGWIPVERELPKDDNAERYIVTDRKGYVSCDMWYGYADEEDKEPCFHKWDDDMWKCYKPDVIAWRTLPEPYQPEQSTVQRPEWQDRMLHTFLGGHHD